MAALVSPKRLRSMWILSILTFGLLGLWLLKFNPGERSLPVAQLEMETRPVVKIRQGKIIGGELNAANYPQVLEQFLGIPYALPTDGDRRFRPPVPVNASRKEFDAGKYGSRCPAGLYDSTPIGEDCLNLNIYRPKDRDPDKLLPVLVYFHGGAFNFGAGQNRAIDHMVAWSAEPMLGLSFNYRVGAFGFLPSRLTARERLLNVGLKDQRCLLEWVQENVAAFGGDPDNVTIMGSSAGAHSIGHHLLLNPDEPALFHKAILESGAATARAVYPYDNPLHERQFKTFLEQLKCEDIPEQHIMRTLRKLDAFEIKRAAEATFYIYNPSVTWPFQPVIDGEEGMIPLRPIDAWNRGKWHQVPILTGFNTNEGAMFVPETAETGEEFTDFFKTLLPTLAEEDLKKLNEVYQDPTLDPSSKYIETREEFGAQFKRLEQAYGHFAYVAPVRQTAHYASAGSEHASVYLYQFAASTSMKGGADHGSQAQLASYDPEIRDVSDSVDEITGVMHAYWTSFITTGDPNKVPGRFEDRPEWPAYNSESNKLIVFGEGNDEIAGGDNEGVVVQVVDDEWVKEECRFWWERTDLSET